MSLPPVPPRPTSQPISYYPPSQPLTAPPVPPLPPDIRYSQYDPPRMASPLAAPQPHRYDPGVPENMARQLDEQLSNLSINPNPGFAVPRQRAISSPPPPLPIMDPFTQTLSFAAPTHQQQPRHPRHQSSYGPVPSIPVSPDAVAPVPALTAPLPSVSNLQGALSAVQNPAHDPALRLAWSRDVLFLVDRHLALAAGTPSASTDPPIGPAHITDSALAHLASIAVPTILALAAANPPTPVSAEATFLRATLAASGAFPTHIPHNPRAAFRDFESAARAGHHPAWFRLGRDYESFSDLSHARDCFERGVKFSVETCLYRMGMAHLLGQLGLPAAPQAGLPLLHRAATLATPSLPQPAYIFALLLLGEFPSLPAPLNPALFGPFIPQSSSRLLEARRHLERAAYLGFAPAQYKLGHAYEFAQSPFPFDPLLSVQYYSLASQQGEPEADMALSKWFLCGSDPSSSSSADPGGFEKDEGLAYTFAEKAARRGLPSAEFAMGYYAEVGVGGPKDLSNAIKWYARARDHGNTDAAERLAALQQPAPAALSRQEHDSITENKLVRRRTQAKQRSEQQQQQPYAPALQPIPQGRAVVEAIRQNSLNHGSMQQPPRQNSLPQQQPLTPAQHIRQQYQQQQQQPQQPPYPQTQPQPQPRPQQHQQQHQHQHQQPINHGRLPSAPHHPQQQQQQPTPHVQFPNAQRYTLTDSPVPGRANRPPQNQTTPPPSGALPEPSEDSHETSTTPGLGGAIVYAAKPTKGPTTFAEMGFQSGKAEDKECVIM